MTTPFDDVVNEIMVRGFHNHRTEDHSATVSRGILRDLLAMCDPFRLDFEQDRVRAWFDLPSPGGRARKLDLVVAERTEAGEPELQRLRLCIENKSVVTAHRNRTNRYDDLSDVVGVLHQCRPDAVLVATVLVGVADKFLNVPDRVKPFVRPPEDFLEHVRPRLSSGDETLWTQFPHAISRNRLQDPAQTVRKFRELPTRPPGRTDLVAYDYVLLVPVFIDNVSPPRIARDNALGIDVDSDYRALLERVCKAYTARWHL